MRITRIVIRNFAYWGNLDLKLGTAEGSQKILITGPNGAGKTTMANAIAWVAVGDKLVSGNLNPEDNGRVEDLWPHIWSTTQDSNGPKEMEEEQSVSLELVSIKGELFQVQQTRPRGQKNTLLREMRINGKRIHDRTTMDWKWFEIFGGMETPDFVFRPDDLFDQLFKVENESSEGSRRLRALLRLEDIPSLCTALGGVIDKIQNKKSSKKSNAAQEIKERKMYMRIIESKKSEIARSNEDFSAVLRTIRNLESKEDHLIEVRDSDQKIKGLVQERDNLESQFNQQTRLYGHWKGGQDQGDKEGALKLSLAICAGVLVRSQFTGLKDVARNSMDIHEILEVFDEVLSEESIATLNQFGTSGNLEIGLMMKAVSPTLLNSFIGNLKPILKALIKLRLADDKLKEFESLTEKGNLVAAEANLELQELSLARQRKKRLRKDIEGLRAEVQKFEKKRDQLTEEIDRITSGDERKNLQAGEIVREILDAMVICDERITSLAWKEFMKKSEDIWHLIGLENWELAFDKSSMLPVLQPPGNKPAIKLNRLDRPGYASRGEAKLAMYAVLLARYRLGMTTLPVIVDDPFGELDREKYHSIFDYLARGFMQTIIFAPKGTLEAFDDVFDDFDWIVELKPHNDSLVGTDERITYSGPHKK